jgi:hypothetical protein
MAVLRSLVQTQSPVAALYRGLTPNLVGNAASWAAFFFLKSRCERVVLSLRTDAAAAAAATAAAVRALAVPSSPETVRAPPLHAMGNHLTPSSPRPLYSVRASRFLTSCGGALR